MDVTMSHQGATLYVTGGSGNSFKPALALHQLEQPHRLQFVDVLAGQTRDPAFLAINKVGRVPYLVDGNGFGVAESNAMLWYVAEGTPLMPSRPEDRAEALQWLFFEQTRLEPNISPARFYTTILPHREAEFAAEIPQWRAKALEGLALLDDHLFTSRFIARRHGYSIADIGVFGYVHLAGQAGIDLGRFRNVSRWIGQVEATPRFLPVGTLLRPAAGTLWAAPRRLMAGGMKAAR